MSFKKFFLTAVALALLATSMVWSTALHNRSAEAAPLPQASPTDRVITVTGYGVAYGAPDLVMVGLGVEASDTDIKAAMEDTNTRMNAVMQALKDGGVAPEDIRTDNYSIYQDYGKVAVVEPGAPGSDQPAQVYRVSIGVTVTVRDPNKVAALLEAAVSAGANIVNYIQFDISDRAALESEARGKAVSDARDRAEQLASLLGLKVGEPLRVEEGSIGYGPVQAGLGGGGGGAMMSVPPISQGTLTVNMSVTITFALEAGM